MLKSSAVASPPVMVYVKHNRSRHAKTAKCSNGGVSGKEQFTVPDGTAKCPSCHGKLKKVAFKG